jgi:hypothetical protein
MIAIVLLGVVLDKAWTPSNASAQTLSSSVVPARLGSLTGNHNYAALYIVLSLTFSAFLVFFVTHGVRMHRWLVKGEAYVIAHAWVDVSLVAIVTSGIVLTRS